MQKYLVVSKKCSNFAAANVKQSLFIHFDPRRRRDITAAKLLGAGSGLFVASIPCIVVGTVKRNNSYELYNQTCARQTALEFGIQTSQNGVGLAMKF